MVTDMKMMNFTKLLISAVFALFTLFAMVSCSLSPQFSEDPELISWIYRNSIGADAYADHAEDFAYKVMNGIIAVDGIECGNIDLENVGVFKGNPETFSEACMNLFLPFIKVAGGAFSEWSEEYLLPYLRDDSKLRERVMGTSEWGCIKGNVNVFNEHLANNKTIKILQQDPLKANMLVNRLIDSYIGYLNGHAQDMVKVINWDYETNSQGDSYTGFLVTYELGTGYYVLVHLIEFEDRWNAEIKYQGDSISELTECYE